MKIPNKPTHPFRHLLAALSLGCCLLAPASLLHAGTSPGDDSSSSTTDDSTGVVTAISPGNSITVKSRRGPFTYVFGTDVHAFGADAKPIKADQVHKGDQVTVYYYHRGGEDKVARIAVLPEKAAGKR